MPVNRVSFSAENSWAGEYRSSFVSCTGMPIEDAFFPGRVRFVIKINYSLTALIWNSRCG